MKIFLMGYSYDSVEGEDDEEEEEEDYELERRMLKF